MRHPLAALLLVLNVGTTLPAQDASDPKLTFLKGEDAGPAFQVAGEYVGETKSDDGTTKIGVQVIAEGGNALAWVAYIGGLPGDGWDGNEPLRGKGELSGTLATLKGETGRGEIRDGSLVVYTAENNRLMEMTRVTRVSPTLGRKPSRTALVLFDGLTHENFENGRMSAEHWLMQGVTSKDKFQSCEVHIEFMLSFMPNARGQARSNSGLYLQGRYEVQMLDSFGLTGEDNECGGLYEISKPAVNMCYPPLSWQTYDIEFQAAKYDDAGQKTEDATITVKHNGVLIHDKVKLPRATRAAPVAEGPEPGPLYLQDHGNEVRYRNIWVQPIADK